MWNVTTQKTPESSIYDDDEMKNEHIFVAETCETDNILKSKYILFCNALFMLKHYIINHY
jgi:hypothetical protein